MQKIAMTAAMCVMASILMTSGMVWAKGCRTINTDPGTNYVLGKLGYFMLNDDKDFDDTFRLGVAFGRFFAPQVSVEVGLEYSLTGYEQSESHYDYDYDADASLKSEYTVSARIIPVTAKYHLPFWNVLAGYIGGGIGLYWVKSTLEETYFIPGINTFFGSTSDDDIFFGLHVVAGVDYAVLSNLSLGGEFKWSKAEANFEYTDNGRTIEKDDIDVGGISICIVGKLLF